MFQALKAAVVGFFAVIQMLAEGLVEYADAFKQTGVATNAYAKTLIPTDEQTQKALDLANENRDLNQQTQLSKIGEAKRKLAEAKAKRDADNK